MQLIRTTRDNPDFKKLVNLLNADLADRDGEDHAFYNQFNGMEGLDFCIVVYKNGEPVSCGAMKLFSPGILEVKRMFTQPEYRGKGLAGTVLQGLESWAREVGLEACRLETGKRQPEAIAFYLKHGYRIIPNFDPYVGVANSVCFEKLL